jgi:membrane protein DedA with SNARE-associated domain
MLAMDSYLMLFAFVLAEQVGLPVPAVPLLLGVGAFAGTGRMSALAGLATALAASLPPDLVWYELGRARGKRVLDVICRLSLEPDSCVRRTENLFMRRGRWALLIAKFLPGLSTIAPPLAGVVGLARAPFLLLDTLGALIWAGAWIALGYVASSALAPVLALAARIGHWGLAAAVVALGGYVLAKLVRRQRFLQSLRIARIEPQELKRRLDAADPDLIVIDTRSALDVGATPYKIPGALWIPAEAIDGRRGEIPLDRKVVLYCS